jgi:dihydrofolate reductase
VEKAAMTNLDDGEIMMNQKEIQLRKVIVFTNLTLDGVMQSPGRREEDSRDGFQFGGWGAPFAAMADPAARKNLNNIGPMLFGRWTYEEFYTYWPHQTNNPYTEVLNNTQKYVASNTLKEPLPWSNSTLLSGDVAGALAKLKAQPGKDFMIMGSGKLVQTLMSHNLVDRFVLLIHPIVLGSGRHLFPENGAYANLQLIDAKTISNGVVVATYQPVESKA